MGLIKDSIDRVAKTFGYIKSGQWGKLWQSAQEYSMFGEKVTKPYAQVSSVYKAVKALADNVPQADLIFRDIKSDDRVEPKELVDLFDRPNPLMSEADFAQTCVGYYALYGECFIVMTQSVGQAGGAPGARTLPSELWPLNPARFRPIKKQGTNIVTAWEYERVRFELDEIIHIKDFNPYDSNRGLSPILPLNKIIDIDWQSLIYNQAFFDNDASPGFMLSTEKKLGEVQIKRLREWWNKRHQGASKAHNIAILESGLKPEQASLSHRDMEFLEQKKFAREEILGTWRVPNALFNITEDLNYATFMGQMKIFWQYSITPILEKIASGLTMQLVHPYNPNIYVDFDMSNVAAFQEDLKEKVTTAKELVAMGFTANEVNKRLELGFEDKPWRDVSWIPFSLVPAGTQPVEPAAEPEKGQKHLSGPSPFKALLPYDPENPEQTAEPKNQKSIEGQLVWQKFLRGHTFIEGKFASALRKYFYEQRKQILASLEGQKGIKLAFEVNVDWAAQDKELEKIAKPHISNGVKSGERFAAGLLAVEVDPRIIDAKMTALIQNRSNEILRINQTVKNQITTIIADTVREGGTIDEMTVAIREGVKHTYNMATSRSKVIARTETTAAMNGGSDLYYKEAGVTKKEWVTAGDEAVRELHSQVSGEQVLIGNSFSNGLAYPGGDGPPEEVINCRCTVAPVIE